MSKVLLINGQGQRVTDTFEELAPSGYEIATISSRLDEDEKARRLEGVEYVVLHPANLSGALIRGARSLRLIQLLAAGYDKVDLEAARACGVPVATNGGANAWAVAEHAIALMLALYKRIVPCDESVRGGGWRREADGFNTFEHAGKTVGIVGAGNIGQKVARRAKAFETDIIYYDARDAPALEAELGARRVSLDELVSTADVLTLHAPLLPATRGLIGARELAAMKPNAILINTSRGDLVDEQALVDALTSRAIGGAGLDVYWQEPIPDDHPLLALDNVVLTPHTAGHALEGWARRVRFAWENIERAQAGEQPTSLVSG